MNARRMIFAAAVLTVRFATELASAAPPDHPIVGVWHVYPYGSTCVETWDIRADGTTHNVSADQESLSTYTVSSALSSHGAYVMDDTIKKSNGKRDCSNTLEPDGDHAVIYLVPQTPDRFKLCVDELLRLCLGTLVRVSSEHP